MRQELFLQNLQAENFQNASQLHGQQLRFSDENIVIMRPELFLYTVPRKQCSL